jgi:secreted PhoX family phosphatase
MLERVSQMAEQVATRASRREFLGRFGSAAMAAATAAGGLLALSAAAEAAPRACDPSTSESQCAGVPVGTPCSSNAAKGTCSDAGRPKGRCLCKPMGKKPPEV